MRRCREQGCITILSSWNDDDLCFLHADPTFGENVGEDERQRRLEELEDPRPFEEVFGHEDMTDEEWEAFKRRHIKPWAPKWAIPG